MTFHSSEHEVAPDKSCKPFPALPYSADDGFYDLFVRHGRPLRHISGLSKVAGIFVTQHWCDSKELSRIFLVRYRCAYATIAIKHLCEAGICSRKEIARKRQNDEGKDMQTSKMTNCTWQFFKVSLLNKVNASQVQMLIWVTAGIKGVAFTYPAT